MSSSNVLAIHGGTPVRTKPFTQWPIFGQNHETRLLEVFRSGQWWYGKQVAAFEREYADYHGARYGITCCNGTVAIEVAVRTLGINAGDEVIVPDYTFIATASAVLAVGAIPVFVDIDPGTGNIALDLAEKAITEKTKAIIVVHFAGLPVDMDRVSEMAAKYDLKVIEDAAHAWGTQWKGKGAGALGDMGTFSFQMYKNITSGEGGIILTDNKEYADLARSYTHCGRVEGKEWYEHINFGGNLRITELQAVLLSEGLKLYPAMLEKRETNAKWLNARLAEIPGLTPMCDGDARVTRRSRHIHMTRFDSEQFGGMSRDAFVNALNAEGIPCAIGYKTPVSGNVCFQKMKHVPSHPDIQVDYTRVNSPAAEHYCKSGIFWFAHSILLGEQEDMEDIVEAISKIHRNNRGGVSVS